MFELPLFPLNAVLFPGGPLRLHIFEERYKRMIALCLETKQPFGVVLIRSGVEALGPLAKPFTVGCTARIQETQPLSGGRMNLQALGEERFRILSLDMHARPFLIGTVSSFPLLNTGSAEVQQAGRRLHAWVGRYLQGLATANNYQVDLSQLPESLPELAYTAATLLQLEPRDKQDLLELEQAGDLVEHLVAAYRREVSLLTALHRAPEPSSISFSRN